MIWIKMLNFKVLKQTKLNVQIMHQNKGIKKLAELNSFFSPENNVNDLLLDLIDKFSCAPLTRHVNSIKSKGYNAGQLLSVLVILPFWAISSVRSLFVSNLTSVTPGKKDAYYRFKNNEDIDWRKILYIIGKRFKLLVSQHGQSDGTSCFILDDTKLPKSNSQSEGVSKIFDHITKHFVWGYKMLLLGYWDGKSLIPLDFSLHRESVRNKKRRYGLSRKQRGHQYDKERAENSQGNKRKAELNSSKVMQAVKMILRAIKHGFKAEYVLTDSWFFCYELLHGIRRKKGAPHIISMTKDGTAKYEYRGKLYTATQLRKASSLKPTRCRSLKARYMEWVVNYKGYKLKLFSVQYCDQKTPRIMVTTNTSLTFKQMMEIYSIRWSIEVLFKEAKQHLNLGKCQSRDFDAQIADATIAMIQYTLLSLSKRFNAYETTGELFEASQADMLELTLAERYWGLLQEIITEICEVLEVSPDELMERLFAGGSKEKVLVRILQGYINETSKKAA